MPILYGFCRVQGCAAQPLRNGFCREHQQDRRTERATRGASPHAQGYDWAWRRVRARYVDEHPLCEDCLEHDRVTPVDEVDHVVPLQEGGVRLDPVNLRSLCRKHHAAKTKRDQARRRRAQA